MKTIEEFMSHLSDLDIQLSAHNDKLRLNAPEDVMTDELRTQLRERKTEILTFFKENPAWSPTAFEVIQPLSGENNHLPLSFSQQRLWFLSQFEENPGAYNMPLAFQMFGDMDADALEKSMAWLVERHTSLRTYFPTDASGEVHARILPADTFEALKIRDLSHLSSEAQNDEVQNYAQHHAAAPFNLVTGPLFNAELLLLDDNRTVLLINTHHIITDAWSTGIFIRDFQHAYTAFALGRKPDMPPLTIQYSDYAAWQRNWLQGELLQQKTDYWRKQLAGCPELLELPTDNPRPPQQSYEGEHYLYKLSPALSQSLIRLSRKHGVTLFMTMLAGFDILLSRYSRQEDLCVGTLSANRDQSQTEDLIGFFLNTLVLRTKIEPRQSFSDLLQSVRKTCLKAYAHQEIPFEILVEQIQPNRNMSHSPLCQVMFVLQNNEPAELRLPGLKFDLLNYDYPTAKVDLTLDVLDLVEKEGQLQCLWGYATDLFSVETVRRIAMHFEALLTSIADNPEQPVSQLNMLTEQEVTQLEAWNNTAADYPKDRTLIGLFQDQVEKTPDNIALVSHPDGESFAKQELSYKVLNEKANQLAHYLLGLKDQEGEVLLTDKPLIAIALDRSPEMVISILAVLKTGGAYLAIDPGYPKARIRYMLDDSAAAVLLTQRHLIADLSLDGLEHNCVVVCLNETDVADQSAENPAISGQADDLAYVIYTSGSTGKPKGVSGTHKGMVNRLSWGWQTFPFEPEEVCCHRCSVNFVDHIAELFSPLLRGVPLILLTREETRDTLGIINIVNQHKITRLLLVPSLLRSLLEQSRHELQKLGTVKYWFCSGEALPPRLAKLFYKRLPAGSLCNIYGSSEVSADVTAFQITPQNIANFPSGAMSVPIGKPISNIRIYISDSYGQPVPVGVPGEILCAGVGLARGYFNHPEITAEKFVEVERFGKTERVYKTGDLARWRPDGTIEYLGRMDHLIKLRGFRIEVGEIESVLILHQDVREAVAVLHETNENERLVAYLTSDSDSGKLIPELKEMLKANLPDYMIPDHFAVLERMPLTPNGKTNRKALSELPLEEYRIPGDAFVAPRTDEEKLLAGIWADTLDAEQVGIHDNFFEMGGHSLLATRVLSRIRETFGIELPLRQLFESPTVADFMVHIEAMMKLNQETTDLSLEREEIRI